MRRFLLTSALVIAAGTSVAAQDAAPQGSAENGAKVFARVGCWTCHDTAGQGGAGTGPRIGPTNLPFAAFLSQLRSPVDQMVPIPPSIVSDAEAADIYAFLQSQKPDDWKQIPLLATLGKTP